MTFVRPARISLATGSSTGALVAASINVNRRPWSTSPAPTTATGTDLRFGSVRSGEKPITTYWHRILSIMGAPSLHLQDAAECIPHEWASANQALDDHDLL